MLTFILIQEPPFLPLEEPTNRFSKKFLGLFVGGAVLWFTPLFSRKRQCHPQPQPQGLKGGKEPLCLASPRKFICPFVGDDFGFPTGFFGNIPTAVLVSDSTTACPQRNFSAHSYGDFFAFGRLTSVVFFLFLGKNDFVHGYHDVVVSPFEKLPRYVAASRLSPY